MRATSFCEPMSSEQKARRPSQLEARRSNRRQTAQVGEKRFPVFFPVLGEGPRRANVHKYWQPLLAPASLSGCPNRLNWREHFLGRLNRAHTSPLSSGGGDPKSNALCARCGNARSPLFDPAHFAAYPHRRVKVKTHKITGGGSVQLHVVETGNQRGRPVMFLHGVSQSSLAWNLQMSSSLADAHRLVAVDLRGHGLSDKPRDAYTDSKLWADDINAVIQSLNLDHPVLSGWSYGPLVFLDYIRHYGEEQIGGLQFVGGVTKLGSPEAMAVLTPEFLNVVPQFLSTDAETVARGLEGLLQLCFARKPSPAE